MNKQQLLQDIHLYGFYHIKDICCENDKEFVYSKDLDSDNFSWKLIDFEIVVVVSLLKGKIKKCISN